MYTELLNTDFDLENMAEKALAQENTAYSFQLRFRILLEYN